MKKSFLLAFAALLPLFMMAGVIIPKNGENMEGVSNIVIGQTEVTYTLDGEQKSLPLAEVHAVLLDDGSYREIDAASAASVEEGTDVVAEEAEANAQPVAGPASKEDLKRYRKEFAADWKAFCKEHKDELKEVVKAVQVCAYKQKGSFFNMKGAVDLDKEAMDEYLSAKARGASGYDAIRARNLIYIRRAEEINAMRGK